MPLKLTSEARVFKPLNQKMIFFLFLLKVLNSLQGYNRKSIIFKDYTKKTYEYRNQIQNIAHILRCPRKIVNKISNNTKNKNCIFFFISSRTLYNNMDQNIETAFFLEGLISISLTRKNPEIQKNWRIFSCWRGTAPPYHLLLVHGRGDSPTTPMLGALPPDYFWMNPSRQGY